MSCKTETREINGITYTVTQWPVETALEIKFRLMQIVGGSLGELAGLMDKDSGGAEDLDKIGLAISGLFKSCPPKEMVSFLKEVVSSARADGELVSNSKFTELYQGDLVTPYKVFFFVLKVNYSDFLSESGVGKVLKRIENL